MDLPGTITSTGMSWDSEGDWKRRATPTGIEAEGRASDGNTSGNSDTRNERVDVPQYQYESDRVAAEPSP